MDARDRARISFEDTRRTPSPQGVMRLRECCLPLWIKHFRANDAVARNNLIRQTLTRIHQHSPADREATNSHSDRRTRSFRVRS
jgi:hypothetical protein